MGGETGISWTDATWNPWMGCTKVTRGCDHCYMFREQRQYGNDPELVRRSKTKFDAPLKMDGSRLIFTCSWSDWFHVAADPWRDEAWEIIRRSPQHTFQILTKRPGRIHRCLPDDWGDGWPNVWLGVSIEDAAVTHRADQLRRIPAALRFISAEPLLGSLYSTRGEGSGGASRARAGSDGPPETTSAVDLSPVVERERAPLDLTGFGWVIVGGESGSRATARPMHIAWAREVRDHLQSLEHRTGERPLLHFKQFGSWEPAPYGDAVFLLYDGNIVTPLYADAFGVDLDGACRVRYAGPRPGDGGRLLDGHLWDEIPGRLTTA